MARCCQQTSSVWRSASAGDATQQRAYTHHDPPAFRVDSRCSSELLRRRYCLSQAAPYPSASQIWLKVQCKQKDADVNKPVLRRGAESKAPADAKLVTSARLLDAMQSAGTLELPPLSSWDANHPPIDAPPCLLDIQSSPDAAISQADTVKSGARNGANEQASLAAVNRVQVQGADPSLLESRSAEASPILQASQSDLLPQWSGESLGTSPDSYQEPCDQQAVLGRESLSQQSERLYGGQLDEEGPSTSGQSAPEMELLFLGTSSGTPTLTRNVSGLLLRMKRGNWLFDCGEGTQHRLLQARVPPSSISKVFISHMHGDHVFGLPGLLLSIMDSRDEIGRGHDETLNIYGPKGLGRYIWANLSMSASGLTIPVTVHELGHNAPANAFSLDSHGRFRVEPVIRVKPPGGTVHWDLFDDERISAKAALLKHRVPCYGYVFEETYERRVDPLTARGWGLEPGPAFAKLEGGESVRLSNGTVVRPADVLEPPQRRKVCILGDTCDSSNIEQVARNADVLVHEATFENKYADKALLSTHSTAGMAGAFAREIRAKLLVLTHFSKRYEAFGTLAGGVNNILSKEETTGARSQAVRRLLVQAMSTFRSSKVIAAEDLKSIQVPQSVTGSNE